MMNSRRTSIRFNTVLLPLLILGCALNPQNADIALDLTLPEARITIYQQAVNQLGLMTDIYSQTPVKIMVKEIQDNTGTSIATSAEIPRDVTEMVKTTLNAIGGNVRYIPYEPEFMIQTAGTGYSDWAEKILPHVVLTGGITEFDRGLVTDGDSIEFDAELGKKFGLNFGDEIKASLASVTLDFNMIDFKTFTGIPRIQAVNGIKLHKATRADSIGFTVKSATFGAKGEITKVQGRHAAVRLLVQLSMLQLIGRYEKLPYWRLIPGAVRDEIVIDQLLADYYAMSTADQVYKIQELLYLHGYGVTPSGQINAETRNAVEQFTKVSNLASSEFDQDLYLQLYENVPITPATRQLKKNLSNIASIAPKVAAATVIQKASEPPKTVEPPKVSTSPESSTGKLSLVIDKKEYKIGETMQIEFSVNQPMYVRMVVINSKGEISTIFPNAYQSDNYCKPGKTYRIPSTEFSLDIVEPIGIDKLRAIASKDPIPAEHLHFMTDGNFDESKMTMYTVRAAADYAVIQ